MFCNFDLEFLFVLFEAILYFILVFNRFSTQNREKANEKWRKGKKRNRQALEKVQEKEITKTEGLTDRQMQRPMNFWSSNSDRSSRSDIS